MKAGEKFRPSNGTELALFTCSWCENCGKDLLVNGEKDVDDCKPGDLCKILTAATLHAEDDPRYPQEWQYGEDGQPMCAAYVPCDEPVTPQRCDKTIDMFIQEAR